MFWIGRIAGVVVGSAGGIIGAITGLVVGTLIDRVLRDALTIEEVRRVLEDYRVSSDRSLVFLLSLLPAGILSRGRRSGLASLRSADLQRCINWARNCLAGRVHSTRADSYIENVARDLCAEHVRAVEPAGLMESLTTELDARGVTAGEKAEWADSALNLVQLLGADAPGMEAFADELAAWGVDRDEILIRLRSQVLLDEDDAGVLGVDRTASAADVKKAYRRLASQLHPDTMSMLNEAQRSAAADALIRVGEAYERLIKEAEARDRLQDQA